MNYLSEYTRVCSQSGRAAHLLEDGDTADGYALCGMAAPMWTGWYGTGSQAEHDRATALRLCTRCARRARQQETCEQQGGGP